MLQGSPAFGRWTARFLAKLDQAGYRHPYVSATVKTWLARQIKALREARGLSQSALANLCGKKQSAIARLEDPDYGKMTLQTLLEIAEGLDVALIVKFADHETFLAEYDDLSHRALRADSYDPQRIRGVGAGAIRATNPAAVTVDSLGMHFLPTARQDLKVVEASHGGDDVVLDYNRAIVKKLEPWRAKTPVQLAAIQPHQN